MNSYVVAVVAFFFHSFRFSFIFLALHSYFYFVSFFPLISILCSILSFFPLQSALQVLFSSSSQFLFALLWSIFLLSSPLLSSPLLSPLLLLLLPPFPLFLLVLFPLLSRARFSSFLLPSFHSLILAFFRLLLGPIYIYTSPIYNSASNSPSPSLLIFHSCYVLFLASR